MPSLELRGSWSLKPDADGFQAHLSGVPFADVQSFMQQVYGKPAYVTTDLDGQPHGLYKALDIGVAIQFFEEERGRGFCMFTNPEVMRPAPDTLR